MTAKTWNSAGSTSWNTAGNWSPTGVPGAGDDVTFDATSVQSCTCDVAINIASLTVTSGYSGTLDFADSAYSHSIGGDFICDGTGAVDFGNAVTTIAGNFDIQDQSTITKGTGEIVLNGTSKTISSKNGGQLYKLTIDGTISTAADYRYSKVDYLVINSTKSLELNGTATAVWINTELTLNGTLICSLGASAYIYFVTAIITGSGSITTTNGNGYLQINGDFTHPAITLPIDIKFISDGATYTIGGNTTYNGNIYTSEAAETVTFDNSGNYNLIINRDVISAGTLVWTKGTGNITASGTANQSWDFAGVSTEEIIVNKSAGTLTLSGNVDPDYCSVYGGVLDIDGNDMTMAGLMYVDGDQTVQDTTGGGLITCGSLNINGTAGHPCVWNGPDLDVTGATANADFCTVTNSNASAGTAITATDCTDNGGNTNWNFGAAPTQYQYGRPIYFTEEMMGALLQL